MPPGMGSAAGRKFLAPPYYSQHAMFVSVSLSAFFIFAVLVVRYLYVYSHPYTSL